MKIIDVDVIWLRVPELFDECEWGEDAVIIKITTDIGIVGYGETDSSPLVVKSIIETPSSHSTCRGLKEILIGKNPLEISKLWDKMFTESEYMGRRGAGIHAISAIDIALWDIAGQYYQVPVHMLLGGKYRDKINAYGTFIPSDNVDDSCKKALSLVEQGFKSIKLGGNGFGIDASKDYDTLKCIREAVGQHIDIAIDLVGLWHNFSYAQSRYKMLEEFNINWIEEPVPSDRLKCYRRLSDSLPVKITGGEALTSYAEFKQFIEDANPAIVQPDITRCGGITEIKKINFLAEENGINLVPHGFSTGILLHATIHFLASTRFGNLIEYSQSDSPIYNELVKNKVPVINGQVEVPDIPGLGLILNEDFIKEYRVTNPN
ncbi:mandelate racemase/muconate lactonizing enzyme family protein [Providencia heimbachae]|uniref:Mandelate racemase/muconate lactonizing enzyme family protein n=1 Tax=Providencia heimbachae ATCC 35613 TaxID=1354272 RepID=A0A1B7JMK4_9GAMM|nr:mandelate racemase/muconate lactonizing enzyme family protein [Providencia heimbachae]OAT49137.1 mandelate racemase/muconate lactonizing enzyme family protein [Providencia heimbachae ATCC 35613]QCJ69261.1 mandelate racemase/muconate lactonizing enzyme family protein [Providencia heimbachae]SQH12335.1 D-galactonate dehydratase [Providencia heimbachae]